MAHNNNTNYRLIPIDTMAYEILDNLAIERSQGLSRIRRWIYTALMEIKFSTTVWKEFKLEFDEKLKYGVPDDLVNIAWIQLWPGCITPIYSSEFGCCFNPKGKCADYKVVYRDRCLEFSSNVLGKFERAEVKYLAAPEDEDGNPLGPEEFFPHIEAYVTYKHLMRERRKYQHSTPSKSNVVAQSEIQGALQFWGIKKAEAKAHMVKPKNWQHLLQTGERFIASTNAYLPSIAKGYQQYYSDRKTY